MPTLTSLTVLLEGDASGLVEATQRGANAIKGFGATAGRLAAIGGAAGVAGLAAAAGTITAIGNAARKSVTAHTNNAAALGTTVKEAQLLGQLSGQSGIGITKLADAMRELGGGSMASFGTFKGAVEELRNIPDEAEQSKRGIELFGKTYDKIAPLIRGGNSALEDADLIFNRLGLGLDDSAEAAGTLTTKLDSMDRLLRAMRDKVFSTFTPGLAEFATQLLEASAAFIEANGGGEKLARTMSTGLIEGIKSTLEWFRQLKESISGILSVAQLMVDWLQAFSSVTAGLAAAGAAVLRGEFSGAGSIISSIPGNFAGAFDNDDDEKTAELVGETKRQTGILERMANRSLVNFQGP